MISQSQSSEPTTVEFNSQAQLDDYAGYMSNYGLNPIIPGAHGYQARFIKCTLKKKTSTDNEGLEVISYIFTCRRF